MAKAKVSATFPANDLYIRKNSFCTPQNPPIPFPPKHFATRNILRPKGLQSNVPANQRAVAL
ncbi:hypothetical protein N7536_000515 [Penicillium majusculum]|nr:hypothetical protein N7536_000515 [Penicillium majusculum]